MVFGSNLADLHGRTGKDDDLLFAQATSPSGQFVQQWELRKMAQEATLKDTANKKLRGLIARTSSFHCADVKVASSPLFINLLTGGVLRGGFIRH